MSTLQISPPKLPSFRRLPLVAAGVLLALGPLWLVAAVLDNAAQQRAAAAPGCPVPHDDAYDFGPADVVRLQVDALQANAALGDDQGIRIAWRLASAANRAATGPFPRFAMMVKHPTYAPLLDHQGARFGPVDVTGDVAQQRVVIDDDGVWRAYRWTLSRARDGAWRTDAVMPEVLE
jgi:hypothetical protein